MLTSRYYECRAVFCPEPEGGYSVFARNLPGVATQGDTLEEATKNVAEAFCGAIETYVAHGMPIPWQSPEVDEDLPVAAFERWILVDA